VETGYMRLRPLGLAVGFAVAAVIEIVLIWLPMAAIHHGMMMRAPRMMEPGGGMMGAGPGMGFLVAIWIIVVSAIVGALVAVVYNAFVASKTP
jgi:hypothetical protein